MFSSGVTGRVLLCSRFNISRAKNGSVPRIAILVALVTTPALAQQLSLSLASGTVAAGGSITLSLSLVSASTQPAAIQWTLTYSTADITSVNVAQGSGAGSKQIQCASQPGMTTCIAAALSDTAISPGNLANVTFQITNQPVSSLVPIGFSGVIGADAEGNVIPGAGTGGQITITNSASLSGLSCTPTGVTTPGSTLCTATLNGAAPSGGFPILLSTSSSSLSVPASVSAAADNASVTFTGVASPVSSKQVVTVTAQANGTAKTFTVDLLPPSPPVILISSFNCLPATLYSGNFAVCTVGLASAPGSTVNVSLRSGSAYLTVPASISVPIGSTSQTFAATATIVSAAEIAIITATGPNNSQSFTETILPDSTVPPAAPLSIWSASAVPGTITDPDPTAAELGMKFRSDVAGSVVGVRFYKGPQNQGTNIGHLWNANGTMLATVTFPAATASGWQQAYFPNPVTIQANTTYIISYYAPAGHYSSDGYFFQSAVNTPPLHALANGASGPNGVYVYGSSAFPNQSWNESNYWVDVLFVPSK